MRTVAGRSASHGWRAIPQWVAAGILAAIPIFCHFATLLPGDRTVAVAIRITLATLAIGIAPGAAIMLVARPRRWQRLHDLLGLAIGLSLVASQIGVFVALFLHISAFTVCKVILGASCLLALIALRRPQGARSGGVILDRDEAIVLLVLSVYALILYLQGSPILSDEDQTHIGIIGRLAALPAPAIDNFYYASGVIYTHPFPGISFLQALISDASGLAPVFVYHKLRFFFGTASILLVYAGARRIFGNRRIALTTLLTVAVLAVIGRFADFGDYFWAQLATYSHPSDVAMNVAMPAGLVVLFAYLQSWNKRAAVTYLIVAIAVNSVVAVSHVREAVQVAVYLGCFGLALLLIRPHRWTALLAKAAIATAVLVLAMFVYTQFHQATVHAVASNEQAHRAALRAFVVTAPFWNFFSGMLPFYLLGWPTVFYGWIPLALAISPVVLLIYRHRPLVLLMTASIFVYLLLIRFPIFSIPFVFLTYSEILMAPARNLTYFAYILTGVGFYWAAQGLSKLPTWRLIIIALALFAVLPLLVRYALEALLLGHIDLFYLPLILALGLAFYVVARQHPALHRHAGHVPMVGKFGPFSAAALLLIPAAAITFNREAAPMAIGAMRRQSPAFPVVMLPINTPNALLARLTCVSQANAPIRVNVPLPRNAVDNVVACPPTSEVVEFLRDSVGTSSVVAANIVNSFPLSMFAPVQIAAWPITTTYNLIDPKAVAPKYYERLAKSLEGNVQPFFNSLETAEERTRFTRELNITHIVVDPMFYKTLMPVLAVLNEYELQFDKDNWAIFKVIRR
jgi:hypothetical protein